VMLCPCDAPFLPDNIVASLQRAALTNGSGKPPLPVAVISYQGVLQPTFSLWQSHHFPVVYEAVAEQGRGGLKQVLTDLPLAVLEWEEVEPSPFFNINTPTELASAAEWLDRLASRLDD